MSTPIDLATSVQSLASSLYAMIPNPADAIRIFTTLASNQGPSGTVVMGGVSDLFRRTFVVALAQASSQYQPTSQDDASALQDQVCTLLDDEILSAGDAGLDGTFIYLTALRSSVAADLSMRGALLPPLQTFKTNAPMPALSLSYNYYRSIIRTDELISSALPAHPAFMPTSFRALSS